MAHFFAPDRRTDGYDIDGKLAPDSVWRMRILTNQRRVIGLWGGQDLLVRSNNPAVVPNDGFGETASRADGTRMLSLLGRSAGTSLLETSLSGSRWCVLQVNVVDVDLSTSPIKDDRIVDLGIPWELKEAWEPVSGSVPVAAGFGVNSLARIPIPGTKGLVVELSAHGYKASTSTVFIWEKVGGKFAKHLRLDYGYNAKTKTVDYHWNRKGAARDFFGIQDHAPVGKGGQALYRAAKYLKWGGRVLLVAGIAVDAVSIVQSSRPLKRATEVVAGWAGAWAGCKVVGAAGAYAGTVVEPGGGTAVGAFVGCIIGGAAGYYAGSSAAGVVYDWTEDTFFTPLPATSPQ